MRTSLFVTATLAVVAAMAWASDTVTLQDERTIYTVECRQGSWQAQHCSGRLVTADRFRFRALKARGEVLFWRVGAAEPSGKFTDCQVQDGRNWNCRPTAETSGTVAHEIVHGRPIADTSGLAQPLHAVPKWKWWLLRRGISIGNDANG